MSKKKRSDELPYTKRLKKEKEERLFWKSLGFDNIDQIATHYNHIDFRFSGVTDEELYLLVTKIRSINMLDLNETNITNHGIAALTQLDNLSELRMKECMEIDNDCIVHLNKITTLKLLGVKSTPITIDGLLGLTDLKNLEELFFSESPVDNMQEKLQTIAKNLPKCQLIMDGKEVL
jgi:hypothetical protein